MYREARLNEAERKICATFRSSQSFVSWEVKLRLYLFYYDEIAPLSEVFARGWNPAAHRDEILWFEGWWNNTNAHANRRGWYDEQSSHLPCVCRSLQRLIACAWFPGKVAIGKARYLLNIVYLHLDVRVISFPSKKYPCGVKFNRVF